MRQIPAPNTEVEINEHSPYNGMRGVVLKSDSRSDLVWVAVNGLSYPLWCHREHLIVRGLSSHSNGTINRYLYADLFEPY